MGYSPDYMVPIPMGYLSHPMGGSMVPHGYFSDAIGLFVLTDRTPCGAPWGTMGTYFHPMGDPMVPYCSSWGTYHIPRGSIG